MIATLKDEQGKVIAYAEYNIVDIKGNYTLHGDYCFIFDVWIHDNYRKQTGLFKNWLRKERNKHPYVTYIYWTRGKYKNKMSKYEVRRIIHGRRSGISAATNSTCSTVNV